MLKFILKRLLVAIPMLFAMAFLLFVLMRMIPGNYFDTMRMDPQISQDTIDRYEQMYGLDKPVVMQYFYWIKNLCRGELGYSFHYNVPVIRILSGRLLNTFILSFASFLLTWGIAIPLGIVAALNRNRFLDRLIQFLSYICLSLPSFLLAMLFLFLAAFSGVLPLGGMVSAHFDDLGFFAKIFDLIRHLIIPACALSIGSIAALQRIMRGNMLEVLGQKYIMAARARGVPEHKVVYHHALRNAINPLITLLGYEFSALLSGAALIEIICNWPGLGSLMLTAVRSRDIYLVMASMLMGSVLFLIGNLIADILLAKADPRIRYEK